MELLRKPDAVVAVRRRAQELSPKLINVITPQGIRQWPGYVLEHAVRNANVIYWDYGEHYQLTIELGGRKFLADIRNVTSPAVVRPYLDNAGHLGTGQRAATTRNTGTIYYGHSGRECHE